MNIMISGSHGLIGSALVDFFSNAGHTVTRLPRSMENLSFSGIDVVIHLAGESIAQGRWNDAKKKRISESRVGPTRNLAEQLAASSSKPDLFISASAIGYYGNCGDHVLKEDTRSGSDFLSTVCMQWEEAAAPARQSHIRTVNLRTGIVLSKEGGALKQMLTPFKLGAGGIIGSGKQYMSWISIDDMIRMIDWIIKTPSLEGPVNLVSPNPATNAEFTKTLGSVLKRPTLLPMPAFAARLAFGEMADALLLSSARVYPGKLIESGYPFKHTDLKSALEDILV